MGSELNLVADLAVILIAAGIFTVISRALKQPPILGYIIAGFLVSPHLGLLPAISSVESVEQWSEIGIIFLLFALGLEFSFKKLLKVGSTALITAGTNCIGMFMVGLMLGSALGWTTMESLFLGGMMSMSSSSVIIKAFNDMGLKKKPFAPLVFGSLIVQDLIAVVLMVLLSTLAVSNQFSGSEMVWNLAKLAFFIILWFLVGIYVIPTLLKKAGKYMNDEILLIISIGLCFGMVSLATAVGFSSALGAFVMGSILAETIEGEHIEHLVSGIKDLFGAIFFVSVGMMIDPAVIGAHWGTILVIALLAVAGILTFITIGALLAGKSLDTAVHTGFSLAQLGEFGFILASLGVSLGVMRDFIYPVIISVSVLTTFGTPFMIKAADPASLWLHRKLPAKILSRINTSDEESEGGSKAEKSEWKKFLTSYATRIVLYSIILIAVLIGSHSFLDGFLQKVMNGLDPTLVKWTGVVITLVAMAPFLYGLAVQRRELQGHVHKLLQQKDSNKWPLLSLMILRLLIAVSFILVFISSKFDLTWWAVLLIVAATLTLLRVLPRYIKMSGLEDRFISNLNAREMEVRRNAPVTTTIKDKLSGYDVHLDSFYVSPNSEYIGRKLRDMPFRSTTGVNIVKIVRGSRSILIPSGDEYVYPYDRLIAVGTSAQIRDFAQMMEHEVVDPRSVRLSSSGDDKDFVVEIIRVTESSYLSDKVLKDLSMRESGCMVLSVLRDNEFITNPKADFRFRAGDSVWIAGEKESCEFFR
ncbi:MAG: cation:proton antiporter [Bacteroidales bacterium]|nr:cation:proton antiporter [Bacteroidales bacterium]MBR4228521.1 cation:proton antiporter [Bacteroidales bacterium]